MIEILAPALQKQAEHNLAARHRHDVTDNTIAVVVDQLLAAHDGHELAMLAYQANIAAAPDAAVLAAAAAAAYRRNHPVEK